MATWQCVDGATAAEALDGGEFHAIMLQSRMLSFLVWK